VVDCASVGADCVIAAGAQVIGSVLGARTRIGVNAYIEDCVIGEGVEVGAGARLEGLVVVGDNAQIGETVSIVGPATIDVGEIREVAVADRAGKGHS
jgi:NDP-sugar pyrophosphorylase family protein